MFESRFQVISPTTSRYSNAIAVLAGSLMGMSTVPFGAPVWLTPAHAQQPAAKAETAQDVIRRAQTEGERRAVEDLLAKLQKRTPAAGSPSAPAQTTATTTAAPAPATATAPAMAPSPAVSGPPTAPAVTPPETKVAAPADEPVPAAPPAASPEPVPSPEPVTSTAPPPERAPASPPVAPNATEIARREKLPSVDLEIYFEFASAQISPVALLTLNTLGRTLADPRLAGQTFVIGGFTDGKGTADYNMRLSQQRADNVRQYLIRQFNIEPNRLIAKGFGKGRMKNITDPQALENRRVQIINWTDKLGSKP